MELLYPKSCSTFPTSISSKYSSVLLSCRESSSQSCITWTGLTYTGAQSAEATSRPQHAYILCGQLCHENLFHIASQLNNAALTRIVCASASLHAGVERTNNPARRLPLNWILLLFYRYFCKKRTPLVDISICHMAPAAFNYVASRASQFT